MGGYLKPQPLRTGPSVLVRSIARSTRSTVCLFNFCAFFYYFLSSLCHFQLKSLIFYTQCQGNFDFWSKIDHYLSICLYDVYDLKFMQSESIFIKQSLDHKKITPSCLLILTNCSLLRDFVKISAN